MADPGASMEVAVGEEARLWIFAADPGRARAFYAQVFGWSLPDAEHRHSWVITTRDDPRLGTDDPRSPSRPSIPTVHVPDPDATTPAARAAGADLLVPRIPVPGLGWLAYLADTEGNLIGVMQDDPQADWPPTDDSDPPARS